MIAQNFRKLRHLLIAAMLLLLLVAAPTTHAQSTEWTIRTFDANIKIQPSGYIRITETISVDFNQDKRGLIRSIPYLYNNSEGEEHYTELNIHSVSRNGQAETFEESRDNGYVNIRVGNENKYLTGEHTYRIEYQAAGVLQAFKGYDELYWNVTGQDWEAAIQHATATVTLPQDKITQTSCYQGVLGSKDSCTIEQIDNQAVVFTANKELLTGHGLTIAVGFTSGMVPILRPEAPPTNAHVLVKQAKQPLGVLAIIITLASGIGLPIWLWYRNGRDWWWQQPEILEKNQQAWLKPWNRKPQIVVEYTPPLNLRPAQVGKLIDQKADTLDVTATIVDLANRGYVTITELDKKWIFGSKDYQLTKIKESQEDLLEYEQLLLDKLFGHKKEIKISSLKNNFYKELEKIKESVRQDAMDNEYFVKSPHQVRNTYIVIGLLALFAGIGIVILGSLQASLWILLVGVFATLSGFGISILSNYMPQRTAKGYEAYRRILGYELFIATAEKHRQQFLENKNIYTQILPYAMVFGLTDKLAKAMEVIGVQPEQPNWYYGAQAFNVALFSQNMQSMSTGISQQMASTPNSSGSGGGGFSGGGFGGGGGGSW